MFMIIVLLFSVGNLNIDGKSIIVIQSGKKTSFNDIFYRESINEKYVLGINSGNYKLEEKYKIYRGNVQYGKRQLKDCVITKKWSLIDEVNLYLTEDNLVYINAQVKMLNNTNLFRSKLVNNNFIMFENTNKYLDHFDMYPMQKGLNNIKLYIKAPRKSFKLQPSLGSGFKHSYQLAVWENKLKKQEKILNTSSLSLNIMSTVKTILPKSLLIYM